MAVRDALLALLTMGPAYGFQLHGGLEARTGGRRSVNVGQTYATLERLTAQRLVAPAGTTDDGLPLYRLTTEGESAAAAWLNGADAAGADAWDETVDRVLLAISLPGIDAGVVLDGELDRWRTRLRSAADAEAGAASDRTGEAAPERALAAHASRAETARAQAALDWLAGFAAASVDTLAFPPRATRPKRGRRPAGARSTDVAAQSSRPSQSSTSA